MLAQLGDEAGAVKEMQGIARWVGGWLLSTLGCRQGAQLCGDVAVLELLTQDQRPACLPGRDAAAGAPPATWTCGRHWRRCTGGRGASRRQSLSE